MVTGDNKDTARAIAKECGIISSADDDNKYSVMEGISCLYLGVGDIKFKLCK